MKLRYLFALPILATALMGCDEIEYSDAKPVENPQLPGITEADFSITPASALVNGINLEELSTQTDDPKTYMVELYKINVLTDALPESAELNGSIQLALSEDFENAFDLTDIKTVDGVVSVPLSSLIYTRGTMISAKDPREYTIYYRVPVYVELNGGQYKLGSKDFYYNDGDSFQEEGVYPGYTVEEAYYLLGPKGTELDSAVKFDHSGYNIYDDTIFTVTALFSEGNDSWLIIPESAYNAALSSGSLNSANVYGTDDAEALEGVLELGGAAGKVESGYKYEFSINLSTLAYTISQKPLLTLGDPTGIYLRGGMNDWGSPATYEFIATDDMDVYILPYVSMSAGTEFKVADADWASVNLGGNGENIVPGTEYALNGGDNIVLNVNFTGYVVLTNKDGNYTLLMQPFEADTEGSGSGIYLRGGMNEWGSPAENEFMTSTYKNVWYLENQSIDAGTEFKVADADWSSINYGTSEGAGAFDETSGTGVLGLVYNGGNISLTANFSGDLRLVLAENHYYLFFILDTAE